MADTTRQAGGSSNRPTRRRSVSRKRSVRETNNCWSWLSSVSWSWLPVQLTDDDREQLTDDDSDQELRRVLKHLGVMRLGGRWQKREEWQEERASPNDSFSSSESSGEEDADIDAKMDALLQGSQKVAIVSHSYL